MLNDLASGDEVRMLSFNITCVRLKVANIHLTLLDSIIWCLVLECWLIVTHLLFLLKKPVFALVANLLPFSIDLLLGRYSTLLHKKSSRALNLPTLSWLWVSRLPQNTCRRHKLVGRFRYFINNRINSLVTIKDLDSTKRHRLRKLDGISTANMWLFDGSNYRIFTLIISKIVLNLLLIAQVVHDVTNFHTSFRFLI